MATAAAVNGKELFRYEDEDTGQVHYMSSLPDGTLEGGWNFDAPEGKSFELTYTAGKETGFVPQADHLPAAPADTEPVQLEKQKFFAFYNNEPVEGYVPVAPADTEDVLSARKKFFAFYNNEAVEDYMPKAPVDTPEVEEAKKAFFDFYNKVQVDEETETSQGISVIHRGIIMHSSFKTKVTGIYVYIDIHKKIIIRNTDFPINFNFFKLGCRTRTHVIFKSDINSIIINRGKSLSLLLLTY